jgi:hypothetical protein
MLRDIGRETKAVVKHTPQVVQLWLAGTLAPQSFQKCPSVPPEGTTAVLSLTLGQSHVVDGDQGRRARTQGPLLSGNHSQIPLKGIVVLSLVVEHDCHVVDGGQR